MWLAGRQLSAICLKPIGAESEYDDEQLELYNKHIRRHLHFEDDGFGHKRRRRGYAVFGQGPM